MKGLILAAGRSTRLHPHTERLPKPLLDVGGRTLLARSLGYMRDNGIEQVCVVVGFERDQVIATLDGTAQVVTNPFFLHTNNIVSLWLGLQRLADHPVMYVHGDLLYHPDLLRECLEDPEPDAVVVDPTGHDAEAMKVKVLAGYLLESSKSIASEDSGGEWIGLAKFSPAYIAALLPEIERLLIAGHGTAYDTLAFSELAAKGIRLKVRHTGGLPWAEIDFPEDLARARQIVSSFPRAGAA